MATSFEFDTVELIEKAILKAHDEKKDIPMALSKGKNYYRKAISSIYSCGLWTMVSSALSFLVSIAYTTMQFAQNYYTYTTEETPYIIGVIIGEVIVCIVPFLIGARLKSLATTPNFTLFLLIVSLIFNLLTMVGILPIVALVFNILALARWSTYKDWFYNFGKIVPKKQG